jgi:DNA-binding NtrC family response regulator
MGDLLLIDDDAGQLVTQVRQTFPNPGHCVAVARIGAEGVARVGPALPDVVLLNPELPDQGGLTVYRAAAPEAGGQLVGTCPAMRQIYKEIGLVAAQGFPVIITGESGAGKELVARAIHQHSHRAGRPFPALNSAAIPEAPTGIGAVRRREAGVRRGRRQAGRQVRQEVQSGHSNFPQNFIRLRGIPGVRGG